MILSMFLQSLRAERYLLVLAMVAGLVVLGASLGADAQTPVDQAHAGETDIVVQSVPAGLLVRYEFGAPVQRFLFQEILTADDEATNAPLRDLLRDGVWQVQDKTLSLQGGMVQRRDGQLFGGFTVLIRPDKTEYGRVYPALARLGRGVVVGVNYLVGSSALGRTQIFFEAPAGGIVLAGSQAVRQKVQLTVPHAALAQSINPESEVVFIGPQDYLREGKVRWVVDPATPEWVVRTLQTEALASLAFFAQRFPGETGPAPTFLLAFSDQGYRARWRGDVSAQGLIAMRLRGTGWAQETQTLRQELSLFVAHEVHHLWNGRLYPDAGGEENSWLHEGAAEYLAIRAYHERGLISDARFDRLMLGNFNRCLRAVGYGLYAGAGTEAAAVLRLSGSGLYTCGASVQWIADSALLQEGEDIFSLWQGLFKVAEQRGAYDREDFYAALPEAAKTAINLLVAARQEQALDQLPGALAPLGIAMQTAEDQLSPRRFLGRLVIPLLRDHCAPPHDFSLRQTEGRYVIDLNMQGRCGAAFPLQQGLVSVEGVDLFAAPSRAYDKALVRCRAQQQLTFATLDGQQFSLPCTNALPPRPRQVALLTPWIEGIRGAVEPLEKTR